jgi:hypothetical protein
MTQNFPICDTFKSLTVSLAETSWNSGLNLILVMI